jgi:hypothetical protein
MAAMVRSSSEQPKVSEDSKHLARQGSIGIAAITYVIMEKRNIKKLMLV